MKDSSKTGVPHQNHESLPVRQVIEGPATHMVAPRRERETFREEGRVV